MAIKFVQYGRLTEKISDRTLSPLTNSPKGDIIKLSRGKDGNNPYCGASLAERHFQKTCERIAEKFAKPLDKITKG